VFFGARMPDDDLDCRVIAHEPLVLIVPCDHPLAARSGVSLDDIAHERFLVTGPGCAYRKMFETACRRRLDGQPRIAGEFGSVAAIVRTSPTSASDAAACARRSDERPAMTTDAPSASSDLARERPMPELPPAINTLSVRRSIIALMFSSVTIVDPAARWQAGDCRIDRRGRETGNTDRRYRTCRSARAARPRSTVTALPT
jgi:DNA-binding transcriptional LysR family regulator